MNSPISFSRSGRSGAHGKNDQRMSADVPQALLDDLDEAVERQREHVPTVTRSEVLRNIVDEDLNGRIGALCQAFPSARGMGRDAAVAAFAAMEGMAVEEYRRWVLDMHIFGRLHVAHDPIVGDEAAGGNVLNGASLGARPDGGR